ncbi:hypothetical protein QR98_0071640 [Sarcoptes scabiei]|uniref:Uncharacterized protein n=1 Tax=Sarcoptes scabiei TaxID=52283 RepID=A0A132ACD7_SARSC|nr:hypothetical protein QR98_0071640 [Sarcoptes scabiei]
MSIVDDKTSEANFSFNQAEEHFEFTPLNDSIDAELSFTNHSCDANDNSLNGIIIKPFFQRNSILNTSLRK